MTDDQALRLVRDLAETLGRGSEHERVREERTFLDSTAQQVMAALITMPGAGWPSEKEVGRVATIAYDAAHALLQERERRRAQG